MDCWHCWLIRYLRSDETFQIRFHVKVRRIRRMRLALQDYQQSTTRSQQQAPASAVSTMSGFLTPPVCHLSRKQRCSHYLTIHSDGRHIFLHIFKNIYCPIVPLPRPLSAGQELDLRMALMGGKPLFCWERSEQICSVLFKENKPQDQDEDAL